MGPYRVLGLLGAGGMGEVYRAYDDKLGREVALKVLPPHTSSDPAAIDRLKKEARTLAALNHPNIATVFGLEEVEGRTLIVLELVEGKTLAEHLGSRVLPLSEALNIGRQVADGLQAAHALGIVHRDVKPSNIKITPENRVKILDFGLARFEPGGNRSHPEPAITATDVTRVAGTPSYMSPEQARGQVSDARADIWAFGCLVYELISGYRAFEGRSSSDVIAGVLDREPRWDRLPAQTPEALRRLLRRCLEKDPARRLHHIADARLEIDQSVEDRSQPVSTKWRRAPLVAAVVTLLALLAAVAWLAVRTRAPLPTEPSRRFAIELPDALPLEATRQPGLALSPDGWRLVYVGERNGQRLLLSQTLGSFVTTPLAGTEGAEGPFFSPNGEWVGFSAEGKLKKTSLSNGSIVTICDALDPRGATWGDDGVITFAPGPFTGLSRVSADGGVPIEVTTLGGDEFTHRWPSAAAGGSDILYTIGFKGAPSFDDADVAVYSVARRRTTRLLKGTFATYVNTGHMVFIRDGALMAAAVDRRSPETVGAPAIAIEGVGARPFSGTGWYAVSSAGTLVYASAVGSIDHSLVWVDRGGRVTPATPHHKAYATPRLSPDGSRIVATVYAPDGTPDLWAYDLVRGSTTRLTFEGLNTGTTWSPDGKLIAFASRRVGDPFFMPWVMSPDGGDARRVQVNDLPSWSTSWSADGKRVAISQLGGTSGMDIMVAAPDGSAPTQPFVQSNFTEMAGVFSPDGRWMAYMSNESGRFEVYVRNFPRKEGRWLMSVEGGSEPVWSRRGNELFFRQGSRLMAVAIEAGPGGQPRIGQPVTLFDGTFEPNVSSGQANFDVGNPPRDFLMVQNAGRATTRRMTVVLNWHGELRQRVP
jgi:eukaryotic-like serine/threonine-protein kinase